MCSIQRDVTQTPHGGRFCSLQEPMHFNGTGKDKQLHHYHGHYYYIIIIIIIEVIMIVYKLKEKHSNKSVIKPGRMSRKMLENLIVMAVVSNTFT